MPVFIRIIETVIDGFNSFFNYLKEFFSLVFRSQMYVANIFEMLPEYFVLSIAPFFIVFVLLMILDRG